MLSTENQSFQGISKEVWFMNKNANIELYMCDMIVIIECP